MRECHLERENQRNNVLFSVPLKKVRVAKPQFLPHLEFKKQNGCFFVMEMAVFVKL